MSSEIAATSEAEPVSHEDLQLKFFNFAPSAFFNTVFQAVDDYIADGLDRMEIVMVPSFSGSEREALKTCNDQLMDLITNTYNKNMDKFEIYATRNLFNIPEEAQKVILDDMAKRASSTPGKRQKASDASSPSGGDKNDGSDNTGIPKSVDDLPSKEEMLKLDEELVQLRNKLRATKRVGHNLKLANMRLQRLIEMASKSSEGVAAAINAGSESIGAPLHDTVSAVVMGKDGLAQLKEEGIALVNQMAEEEDVLDENVPSGNVENTAEGMFAAAKSAIQTSSARDISNLTNILKN